MYWFEIVSDNGSDGVIARNIIGAAKRKIKSQPVPLEKLRLFPLLRSRDAEAWSARPSAWLLFVQDPETRRGRTESEMAQTPKALEWLEQNKTLLLSRAAYRRFFKPEKDPFWSMFDVGEYTLKPWKVVWPRIASRLEAAVVSGIAAKPILPQETFSFIGLDDETEAFYVAGVINSTPFRFAVNDFAEPARKLGPEAGDGVRRSFPGDPHLRSGDPDQRADAADGAPDAAKEMHEALDSLSRNLWGLDEKELKHE